MNERPKIQKSRELTKSKIMSETEKWIGSRADSALRELRQTLERNWYDTGRVMDDYEAVHDDYELCHSKTYQALNAAHFALKETIDKIDQITK